MSSFDKSSEVRVGEAARILGCSIQSVYNKGQILGPRIVRSKSGRAHRYYLRSVVERLARQYNALRVEERSIPRDLATWRK